MARIFLLAALVLAGVCAPKASMCADAQAGGEPVVQTGDVFLVVNTLQFDMPVAAFNETEFRSTVANFFQLDTSQVVINQVYPKDSGTAVQFYAIFADRVSSLVLMNFLKNAMMVRQVFAASPTLNKNPRIVEAVQQQPMGQRGVTATGGAGGVGTGGGGGMASGNIVTPGSPGVGVPGSPGTVTGGR